MSADRIPFSLDNTVTARWRRRLIGAQPDERRHWRTRTAYYAATSRLLAEGNSRPAWSEVIDAVRPRGSRSTFYEVAGAHAKHTLIGELLANEAVDSLQLALYYRRKHAVEQLIDETKVWTYWPYRELLQMRYRIEPDIDAGTSVEMLTSAVASWARRNVSLASALCCAPPVCAVEDMLVLRSGSVSATHAASALTRVVQDTTLGTRGGRFAAGRVVAGLGAA